MATLSYDEALAAAGDPETKHLILGNGFSISLRPDIFTYASLLQSADFEAAPQVEKLFEILNTQDFELVIKHLIDSATVVKIYEPGAAELIAALEHDAELVKEALVTAIAKRHPDRPYDILAKQYRSCRAFLSQFGHIYTLNYDVLLYWTLMNDDVDELGPVDKVPHRGEVLPHQAFGGMRCHRLQQFLRNTDLRSYRNRCQRSGEATVRRFSWSLAACSTE